MAKSTSGAAGASVRRMACSRLLAGGALLFLLLGLLYAVLTNGGRMPWWLWLAALLVLPEVTSTVMRTTGRRTDRAIRGAEAEEAVARELDKLGDDFHVVHDVIVGPGNIDHVVIGPAGLFTIETKSHRGQITFAHDRLLLGKRPLEKNFLAQAYAESRALKEYLKKATSSDFAVNPVIVFSAAYVKVRGKARGVDVIPLKWMNERLSRGTSVLDEGECARLARAIAPLTDQARRSG